MFKQVFIVLVAFSLLVLISTRHSLNHRRQANMPIAKRIVGGTAVDEKNFPFIAGLVKVSDDVEQYFCGGCIISKYWVISADHCFRLYIYEEAVTVDTLKIVGNNNTWKNGIFHDVDHWVKHEPEELDFDIALFKVRSPFVGQFEKPISIAEDGYILRKKTYVNVLGWGAMSGDEIMANTILQGASLRLYSDSECRKIYAAFAKEHQTQQITPRMFCAGPAAIESATDSCNYDSGGPIVDDDLLIGIVSWGAYDMEDQIWCGSGYPGVYARLWKFEDWIHEIEKKEGEKIANFKLEPSWITEEKFP